MQGPSVANGRDLFWIIQWITWHENEHQASAHEEENESVAKKGKLSEKVRRYFLLLFCSVVQNLKSSFAARTVYELIWSVVHITLMAVAYFFEDQKKYFVRIRRIFCEDQKEYFMVIRRNILL